MNSTQVDYPTCHAIFTGQRYDAEIPQYYFKSRYYSFVLGRFVNRDGRGYIDGPNMYAAYFASHLGLDPFGELLAIAEPSQSGGKYRDAIIKMLSTLCPCITIEYYRANPDDDEALIKAGFSKKGFESAVYYVRDVGKKIRSGTKRVSLSDYTIYVLSVKDDNLTAPESGSKRCKLLRKLMEAGAPLTMIRSGPDVSATFLRPSEGSNTWGIVEFNPEWKSPNQESTLFNNNGSTELGGHASSAWLLGAELLQSFYNSYGLGDPNKEQVEYTIPKKGGGDHAVTGIPDDVYNITGRPDSERLKELLKGMGLDSQITEQDLAREMGVRVPLSHSLQLPDLRAAGWK